MTTRLLTQTIQYIEKEGITLKTLPAGTVARGFYDSRSKTIWLNPRLTTREYLPVLLHELAHHQRGDVGKQPLHIEKRIDEKVAAQIISVDAYALAEYLHQGDVHAIADELDTPIWLVNAFQRHLKRAVLT